MKELSRLSDECISFGCMNKKADGSFTGNMCDPCYEKLTTGVGKYGTGILFQVNKPSEQSGIDGALEKKWREETNEKFKAIPMQHVSSASFNSFFENGYLQACRARQSEIELLKAEVDKANREVIGMVEIHKRNREEIESLKAEIAKRDELLREWLKSIHWANYSNEKSQVIAKTKSILKEW